MKKCEIFSKGIIKENPVLVLLLGTCPALATTTGVISALAMGIAATAVLFCSNIVISMLRKAVPDKVRIPCYIVVIAGFVSVVQMLMHAYFPDLYDMLGVYLALIVVNCIILGRAEMFARKNGVIDSALDGLGMGIGFTLALVLMASFREVIGAGTWAGIEIPVIKDYAVSIMTASPGGFLAFGCLVALVAKITSGKAPAKKSFSCEGCPNAAACNKESCETDVKEETK
ncbi:MAG: electron transport complex subunit E [Oscillospiraceae bacterium]|nr:electron transport complex subunit E [Oscillospiraceae bacterium]MBR3953076.1 electron transport complex subunit E [Oscillospiraceae bacterium]